MRHIPGLLTILLLLVAAMRMHAQPSLSSTDQTYGLDPLLHNGSFYSYFIPSDTEGTPFFSGPDFVTGSVTLRDVRYDHLALKYDVVNQQLVFQYQNPNGGVQRLVLSDAWMQSFDLGNIHFELFAAQDTVKHIYQVLGSGFNQVLYGWSKQRTFDNRMGYSHFKFTKLKKKMYLLSNGDIREFKNNKGFTTLFDPAKQPAIKKYLMQQHIKVTKATDQVMTGLITYSNSL